MWCARDLPIKMTGFDPALGSLTWQVTYTVNPYFKKCWRDLELIGLTGGLTWSTVKTTLVW